MSETANSGIFVTESLASGQPIAVRRDTVVAFIGAAPRGPVGMPVSIGSLHEYQERFGMADHEGPLHEALKQFFDNGGPSAIVVRVCSSTRRHRIELTGVDGSLTLEAINPGPHELLRASVDYDGVAATDPQRFNLVIHRLESRDHPIVEQQEFYRGLSVDVSDSDFVADVLLGSELVTVSGDVPRVRPHETFRPGIEVGTSYVYVDREWPEPEEISDYDLIGSNIDGTGLFALERLPNIDVVCLVPDADDAGPVALLAAERYCRQRNAMLFVDPSSAWQSVHAAVHLIQELAYASPNIATYYPRPIKDDKPVSALGSIVGALAAGDARIGIWGHERDRKLSLRCKLPFTIKLEAGEQAALLRAGINPLRAVGSQRLEFSPAVTLNSGGGLVHEWNDLTSRRIALFVAEGISRGTRWAAMQTSDSESRAELRAQISLFLHELSTVGALDGGPVADAFFVACDGITNPPSADGQLGVSFVVGLALHPNTMMNFRFDQRPGECVIHEIGSEPGVALAS